MTESAMEWAMSEDGLCLSAQSVGQSPSQAVPGTLVLRSMHEPACVPPAHIEQWSAVVANGSRHVIERRNSALKKAPCWAQ
jgi:hypothetical protein